MSNDSTAKKRCSCSRFRRFRAKLAGGECCNVLQLTGHRTPNTISSLETLVWSANLPCQCDICSPEIYTDGKCVLRTHLRFNLHKNLVVNKYGYIAYQAPKFGPHDTHKSRGIHRLYKTECMHLARTAIEYFDRPWEYLNDEQLQSRENLLRWIDGRTDIREPSEEEDAEKLISGPTMRVLWKWINELFFGGDFPDAIFKWTRDITNTGEATSSRPPLRTWRIVMHPDKTALDLGPYPVLAILSTLIHEAVHILLDKYGCHPCATWNENQQAIWHGRPWQLVAAKLEEVVPRLLGISIKLGRLHSLLHGWGWQYLLPSRHDIAAYGSSSVRLWSEEDEDLKELIAATARLHKYQPVHIPTGTRC
jgi:hypothetical protein